MSNLPRSSELFEFLDDTHRKIHEKIQRINFFVSKIESQDLTPAERKELHEICDFFETEARQHHLDEETHIFPSLLSSPDESIVQLTRRLTQDHGWLEENWIEIDPQLDALSQNRGSYDFAELSHAMIVLTALYDEHMQLEEELAYPQAKKLSHTLDVMGAGREMAQRRHRARNLKVA